MCAPRTKVQKVAARQKIKLGEVVLIPVNSGFEHKSARIWPCAVEPGLALISGRHGQSIVVLYLPNILKNRLLRICACNEAKWYIAETLIVV